MSEPWGSGTKNQSGGPFPRSSRSRGKSNTTSFDFWEGGAAGFRFGEPAGDGRSLPESRKILPVILGWFYIGMVSDRGKGGSAVPRRCRSYRLLPSIGL